MIFNIIISSLLSLSITLDQVDNYIIAVIDIPNYEIGKKVRILNSHEEMVRSDHNEMSPDELNEKYLNEEQIKDSEISLNGEVIGFSYFYIFQKEDYILLNTNLISH